MKNIAFTIILGLMLAPVFSVAQAANAVEQRYIKQMTTGGNHSLKRAAKSIYNTGKKSTEVLDVAAEVLMQRYPTAGKKDADTLAWLAKAIGSSRNGRYHTILKEVVESDAHGSIRKWAKWSLKKVGDPTADQYVKGTIDLATVGKSSSAKKSISAKKSSAPSGKRAGKEGLDVVVEGMSQEEVFDLVGHPTATTSHQTGRAWQPFNFGAKDVARSEALYKGQGRVIFSHSGYGNTQVIEVVIDPEESGYP